MFPIKLQYGFPGDAVVKDLPANAGDTGFDPWVGKIPWSRKWWPTPVFLPGEFHWQRSLVGYSPWGSQRVGHDWVANASTFQWLRLHASIAGDRGSIPGQGIEFKSWSDPTCCVVQKKKAETIWWRWIYLRCRQQQQQNKWEFSDTQGSGKGVQGLGDLSLV